MMDHEKLLANILNSPEHHDKFIKHVLSIEKMRQQNQNDKIELERIQLNENIKLAKNAQFYAFLIAICGIVCGSFIAYFGHETAGAIIGTSGLGLAGMSRLNSIKELFQRKQNTTK